MTYGLVPDYIVELHRALLLALRVDFFRPGIQEMNAWRDFLFVMQPLEETSGGAFTKQDLAAVVARMRAQNKNGGNWSLRFAKIMATPESFRDLVLETRRTVRERPAKQTGSRTAGNVTLATESDPAAESEAEPISEGVARFMAEFNARKARRAKQ